MQDDDAPDPVASVLVIEYEPKSYQNFLSTDTRNAFTEAMFFRFAFADSGLALA